MEGEGGRKFHFVDEILIKDWSKGESPLSTNFSENTTVDSLLHLDKQPTSNEMEVVPGRVITKSPYQYGRV